MEDDGGAVLTERIWLSRMLLELSLGLRQHLLRESAFERVESIANGMILVSHNENLHDGGSVESLTLFQISSIEDLRLPNQPTRSGRPSGPMTIRLLSFTGADLDRRGEPFVENEEAMLALLQFRLNESSILRHTAQFPRNERVPVHRGRNPYGSRHFQIRATQSLFQKYFAGRPMAHGGNQ